MNIKGKKITILGAVRSGVGAAKLAKKLGAVPFVSDMGVKEQLSKYVEMLEENSIPYETGGHSSKVFDCDFIVTSPGVPSDAKVILEANKKNIPVISELEFASSVCKGKIISITGTNGKTTTTSLAAHLLNECGVKTYSAGNIGVAFSELVLDVKENEYVALETSSFQLDHIKDFKPGFAMILNITPDHLDRYENSFEKYTASKMKITGNQLKDDYFIYNADDKNTPALNKNYKGKVLQFSLVKEVNDGCYFSKGKLFYAFNGGREEVCSAADLSIKGEHNIANALAVLCVAKSIGLPNEKIKKAFGSFPGVEHRLEYVRTINNVRYINDSKATNVDSVWYALRSFDEPIYLILGGKDKGNDYEQIKELVKNRVVKIYAIGTSAKKVYDFFNGMVEVDYKESMEACVEAGRKEAKPGSIFLLSPACASFDMFDNYEHRGKVFKQAVGKLSE